MITETSWVIIPLALASLFLHWRWILLLTGVSCSMTAASVLIFGGLGISPGHFMVATALARLGWETSRMRNPIPYEITGPLGTLLLFLLVTILVLWFAVVAFSGRVLVLTGADAYILENASPYSFRRENISQYGYLFLGAFFALALGYRLSRMPLAKLRATVHFAIVGTILIINALCLYEAVAFRLGLPWPFLFFHSSPNSSWRPGDEELFGVVRAAGPFSEPSALALFYGGYVGYTLRWLFATGSHWALALTLLGLLIMLLSLSSTAAALVALFGMITVLAIFRLALPVRSPKWLSGSRLVLLVVLSAIAVVGLLVAIDLNIDVVTKIYHTVVTDKTSSGSYVARSGADHMALDILEQTGGIGIGVGSHRPSSLLLALLSNTGIVGTFLFGLWVLQLVQPLRETDRRDAKLGFVLSSVRWMLLGTLAGSLISGPSFSLPALWLVFGLNLALVGAVRMAERRVRIVTSPRGPVAPVPSGSPG